MVAEDEDECCDSGQGVFTGFVVVVVVDVTQYVVVGVGPD